MIPFNKAPFIGEERNYIDEVILSHQLCGDGPFTRKCSELLEAATGASKVLMTTSCTHAIEMASLLCNIEPGDEVIMPSFTFVSTANAFVLRGARIRFVDIRPDTMNIDENLIETAITEKTKAIVPVHYAGVSCEMNSVMKLASDYNLFVIEDAAQAVSSLYEGKALGSIGDYGCYSFHETKNYSMGEGGALIVRNSANVECAEIIREKGTNRTQFFRGQIDKYTWVDKGSSYLPSELNVAYLYAQLINSKIILDNRMKNWNLYFDELLEVKEKGLIDLPFVPSNCNHNAHMFYIKCKDIAERTRFIEYMKHNGVSVAFHYVPLHSAPAGKRFGEFIGEDKYTTKESERLVRLPLFYGLKEEDVLYITDKIKAFYNVF